VVLALFLSGGCYPLEAKSANWEYYEPRTEHGSTLSACSYSLIAAQIGKVDWAYQYFMKTATIDLTGEGKEYVGTLYIGGTHPAANGGAWMSAVLGIVWHHRAAIIPSPLLRACRPLDAGDASTRFPTDKSCASGFPAESLTVQVVGTPASAPVCSVAGVPQPLPQTGELRILFGTGTPGMIREMRAAIFDLDGVIVDTAKYHYLAWKRLANQSGFDFNEADNERLKGVSRVVEILLDRCPACR